MMNLSSWNTDTLELAKVILKFEKELPGFWWSVGQCSVGAHASCAVDGSGTQTHLLDNIVAGHPYDSGFHCDTLRGSPAEALSNVMEQALEFMKKDVK
jgi:hypothetical protein